MDQGSFLSNIPVHGTINEANLTDSSNPLAFKTRETQLMSNRSSKNDVNSVSSQAMPSQGFNFGRKIMND